MTTTATPVFDEETPSSIASAAFVDHFVGRYGPLEPVLAWVADL